MSTNPTAARVLAPAKVNFGLRILGRRDDGYHDLDSLFVPVSVHDEVAVRLLPEGTPGAIRLHVDGLGVPADETNLVHRAARSYLGERPGGGLEITLAKRIPVGAGLGGGSSDAAAVLRLLARLLPRHLTEPELHALASRLGADVPFFLVGRPARVRGTGDRIEPLDDPEELIFAIVHPGFGVSTAWAYAAWDAALTSPGPVDNIRRLCRTDLPDREVRNDFDRVVEDRHPGIRERKKELIRAGAIEVGLSGSGAAVFGRFGDLEAATKAAATFRERGLWAEAVRSLKELPEINVE